MNLKLLEELDQVEFLDRDELNKYIDNLDHNESPGHNTYASINI